MRKSSYHHQRRAGIAICLTMFVFAAVWISFVPRASAESSEGSFQIGWAEWNAEDGALKLKGSGAKKKEDIVVKDAATGEIIGTTRSEDEGKFEFKNEHMASVPCGVLVENDKRFVTIGFTEEVQKKGGKAVLIREAEWKGSENELVVKGQGSPGDTVMLFSSPDGIQLGSTQARQDGAWRKTIEHLSSIPCRIQIQMDRAIAEMGVKNAPEDCETPTPPTPPATPLLTGITIAGPTQVVENGQARYMATAAYSDGSTRDVTTLSQWQIDNSLYAQISGNGLTASEVPANQQVLITATFGEGGITRSDSIQLTILDQSAPLTGSHAGRFSTYDGTATCLACHTEEAIALHGGVHYQWKGDASETVGLASGNAGKLGGINDFCIYPDINWIGKLTNVSGQLVDGGCAKCHVGLGAKPEPVASQSQLENIDCLVCHSAAYKRTVGEVDGASRFVPDTQKMGVSILQAAVDITIPSNDRCLDCHTKAGGGNNYKRGDIEEAHRNPTRDFDVHLSSRANGGAGLNCIDCHTAAGHRIAGRGTDLRPRDSQDEVSCTKCHGSTPHDNSDLNKHTSRVNCTVCHIPTFAKVAPTDMARDWSLPGELNTASGLYEPANVKMTNVIPEYLFFNGTSYFYQFGDPAVEEANGIITMSAPLGDVTQTGAKIYAFKHHLGNQPIDPVTRNLLPLKIGLFFQTGGIDQAVQQGAKEIGWSNNGYEFAQTERFMGLFHEVAPSGQALSCNDCHSDGGRMDFPALGYSPNATYNGKALCASCHEDKSNEWRGNEFFNKVHEKHVDDKKYDCSKCHAFSKAK